MRRSRVLERLRAGKIAKCFKVNLNDPKVTEIVAISGFDCVWLDQEHISQDPSVLAAGVWAAKAHDTDVMVRVSRGSYSDYIKPLEMDAAGILVPHIMNLEDAQNVIKMVRFHPLGRRPIDGGNADGAYATLDFKEYIQQANKQRFVALQIEDPEPLEDLEAIAALEGYDMLFFGPGDFSQGIGAPGQWNHPRLIETRKLVAEMANKHGKYAATVGNPDNLNELMDMGYHFISMGADVVGLSTYCNSLLQGFKTGAEQKGGNSPKGTESPYK
ncbi:HpcH/HpaI aldolase family protein [Allomuricauda sp. CP2A]|jgi:4-hydroxy-2-oxoheptanedioate aldolase|uniref:HpcH/HpaI aldolase family protein n=1 Tax=Allomuricauda sp. CP2A TaxID=1848189 RepID=UPI0008306186|nr:aldolase/citrate lyase family protein [Muricauda sp. CP2A]